MMHGQKTIKSLKKKSIVVFKMDVDRFAQNDNVTLRRVPATIPVVPNQ
jgi:hypothetical protein